MNNALDWDSLSPTPPGVRQDTSTPEDATAASVADWANQQIAQGVPADQVDAQVGQKLRSAGLQVGKSSDAPSWDDLSSAPPKAKKSAAPSWDDLTPTPPSANKSASLSWDDLIQISPPSDSDIQRE